MEWIPEVSLSLKEVGAFMLPTTATILGLIYAALIYWLQGGISQLEHTKSLLEDTLIASSRILLDLLIGASIISLCGYLEFKVLASISFWIFLVVFIHDELRSLAEQGYIRALSRDKFIPGTYGPFRSFLRKVQLSGLVNILRSLWIIGITTLYPIYITSYEHWSWMLNDTSLIVFIFSSSIFSLLQVKSLLTLAFEVKKELEKKLMNDNEVASQRMEPLPLEWDNSKRNVEQRIITERLHSINLKSTFEIDLGIGWNSRALTNEPVVSGQPIINESTSCHINIIIPYLKDDIATRDFVFTWTRTILTTIDDSKSEVRNFALSFFRKDEDGKQIHLALFRVNSNQIKAANTKSLSDLEFVRSLSGKYLDNIIAMM